MFEFDQHFRETEYAWLQYLDDNGYLVPERSENWTAQFEGEISGHASDVREKTGPRGPVPTYCTCPTPSTPEYADMRVYVCTVCSGLVVLTGEDCAEDSK